MKFFRIAVKVTVSLCAIVAWFLFGAASAGATGDIVIRQPDGDVNLYKSVDIKIIHGALFLTSEDGKGTLVVHKAACSYQGKLLVCFATSATLVQAGKTSPLDLTTGTVYLNDTDDPQPLVLSTTKVPPRGIIASLTTNRGTYISLNGRIDKVVK